MTSPPISSGPSLITVLYQAAQNAAALTQNQQLAEISQDLQNQMNQKVAALQGDPIDQVSVNYSQAQINNLQKQQSTISALETTFSKNGEVLSDMTSQLNTMAQAASGGDGTSFDNALSALTTDLSILAVPASYPLFQNDGVNALKMSGFSIQSSASYNLSTPSGQAAATADVTTAQNLVQGILKTNGSNQTIAGSQVTALNDQITALQTLQTQQQTDASQATEKQIQQLQTNMQNQLHLIQLNMGGISQLATEISQALNPPQPVTSVFGALSNSVGESAKTAETQLGQTPAVLSLFA